MSRPLKIATDPQEIFPPLPLTADHWQAITRAMRFSPQHARIVELVLRGMCDKQISTVLGISVPTIRTYLQRISVQTRTRGRMELAMRILEVSHQVSGTHECHQK